MMRDPNTYSQDWKTYTTSQTRELEIRKKLLRELVECIQEPPQFRGRPRHSRKEIVYCAVQKVANQLSSRRAYSLYKEMKDVAAIEKVPNYNVINIAMNDSTLTPVLYELLWMTAEPLKDIEETIAIDSSGFATNKRGQYRAYRFGKTEQVKHEWVKCHAAVGTLSNAVLGAIITEQYGADMNYLKPLVDQIRQQGFAPKEIVADKGYSSIANVEHIAGSGAFPYIPFKRHVKGNKGSLVWRKLYHYIELNRDSFYAHYHQRSNIESTFSAIKTKFGEQLKSKNFTAQQNELLCKLIAYNISVLAKLCS